MQNLERLGWNDFFQTAMNRYEGDFHAARVTAEHRGLYQVAAEPGEIPAEVTGKLMFSAENRLDYPVVGDWVLIDLFDRDTRAIVHHILPRKSLLARKYPGEKIAAQAIASNIDIVFLVMGLDGNFNLARMERYLAAVRESGARPVVLLTKSDLRIGDGELLAKTEERSSGATVLPVSAITGDGLDALRRILAPGVTACCVGSSGSGKSTIINVLAGRDILKTAPVREQDSRGRHTTTHRELFCLDSGAIVIDTPGMREFGLWSDGSGIDETFSDIADLEGECRFPDCSHIHEPGCAVLNARNAGVLDLYRYENYLKLRKEQEFLETKISTAARLEKKCFDKSMAKAIRDVVRKKGRGER